MNAIEQLLSDVADYFEQLLVARNLRQELVTQLDAGNRPTIVRQLPVVYGRTDLLMVVGRASEE